MMIESKTAKDIHAQASMMSCQDNVANSTQMSSWQMISAAIVVMQQGWIVKTSVIQFSLLLKIGLIATRQAIRQRH